MLAGLKDAANPFVRLVNSVTTDDGNINVTHFYTEQIKDATYQSDNGCESVFKALSARLESQSPVVKHKVLVLMRALMLEGPASFNNRMGSLAGKMQLLAKAQDVRKDTVEEHVMKIAQAIYDCIAGDSKALARMMTAESEASPTKSYKTDFQQQQQNQMKMFKKRQEEKKGTTMVVNERLHDTFDGSAGPNKLVDQAVSSTKKKFAKEEIESFCDAAEGTEKVVSVCVALDNVLKDGKSTLSVRYKILMLVEIFVKVNDEAAYYFKEHAGGVNRHMTIDQSDNPAKSQLAQGLAQSIVASVRNAEKPIPKAQTEETSPKAPVNKVAAQPPVNEWGIPTWSNWNQQQPQQAASSGFGSQPFGTSQSNAPQTKGTQQQGFDELFSQNSRSQVPPQQNPTPEFPNFSSNAGNMSPPMCAVPNNSLAFGSGTFSGGPSLSSFPVAPNNSFAAPGYSPGMSLTQPPAVPNNSMVTPPEASTVPPPSADQMQQMMELQRNMQMMMQMMQMQHTTQQTSAQQTQPQAQSAQPQPQPIVAEASAHEDPSTKEPSSERAEQDESVGRTEDVPKPTGEEETDIPEVQHEQQQQPSIGASMEAMSQMQEQMKATQALLQQQQQQFEAMQKVLMANQKPQ